MDTIKTVIFIPARYASTRFPGKPLAQIKQPDGSQKMLLQMTWESAKQVEGVDAVYVATDDFRIAEAARGFGADVVLTNSACENGTARCADALARMDWQTNPPGIIINFQGDAPLTPPWFVEALIAVMQADPSLQVATPVLRCDEKTYENFREDRQNRRVGGTTVVFDHKMQALYFSKEVVPFIDSCKTLHPIPVFHHVGIYAYRPDALRVYAETPICQLELMEGLEQLRFLHNGTSVRCVEVNANGRVFWELNNPLDIQRIESAL